MQKLVSAKNAVSDARTLPLIAVLDVETVDSQLQTLLTQHKTDVACDTLGYTPTHVLFVEGNVTVYLLRKMRRWFADVCMANVYAGGLVGGSGVVTVSQIRRAITWEVPIMLLATGGGGLIDLCVGHVTCVREGCLIDGFDFVGLRASLMEVTAAMRLLLATPKGEK